ncbi:AsnC family protein [Hahella sp. CCB-MM4]|nr:AsnC family protein [Hahella sp. CCB-MM4]
MEELDRTLINTLQYGLPICDEPFARIARALGTSEGVVLDRLKDLLNHGYLTRFGPLFHAEQLGGALTLAAMRVPADEVSRIAEMVNRHPEVAHNYERDHDFNIWFVIATEQEFQIQEVIESIESETGYPVYNLPKQREFYVGLHFKA